MPQLAIETFPSQIFWVLVGFFIVYVFMSFFAAPNLEKIIANRAAYVDSFLKNAAKLDSDAKKINKEALEALQKAEEETAIVESKLIASFKEQSEKEKKDLYRLSLEEFYSNSKLLSDASEKCFNDIAGDIDGIVNTVMLKMSSSANRKRENIKSEH